MKDILSISVMVIFGLTGLEVLGFDFSSNIPLWRFMLGWMILVAGLRLSYKIEDKL